MQNIPKIIEKYKDSLEDIVFQTNVHGSTFLKDAQDIMRILQTVNPESIRLKFEHEKDNQYDENATVVYVSVKGYETYQRIGYIPKEISDVFAYILDELSPYRISYGNIRIFGGTPEKENYGLFFDYKIIEKESHTNG